MAGTSTPLVAAQDRLLDGYARKVEETA
jgi:hypothetical protein